MSEKRYIYITPFDYEVAKTNGISAENVECRVRQLGWDVDKAITKPVTPRVLYGMVELYKANGISRQTYSRRVREGMSPLEAATLPTRTPKEAAELGIGRRKLDPYIKRANENGISYQTFHSRISKLGWPKELACTKPVRNKKGC